MNCDFVYQGIAHKTMGLASGLAPIVSCNIHISMLHA